MTSVVPTNPPSHHLERVLALARFVVVVGKDLAVVLACLGVPEELSGGLGVSRCVWGGGGRAHLAEDDEVEEDGSPGPDKPRGVDEDVLGGERLEKD